MEEKKAVTSTDMIGYIRQIDASIKLAFERRPYGDYEQTYEIVRYYNAGDVENLTNFCKKKNTNIIVYDNSIELTISPTYFGFELYAQTEHYDIYVLKKEKEVANIEIDEETIKLTGIKGTYKICFLNDLHIIVPDNDVSDENRAVVEQRKKDFTVPNGKYTADLCEDLPKLVNSLNSDCTILGGDMIDYISASNVNCLQNMIEKIDNDSMYLRADHDNSRAYNKELTKEYADYLQKNIDDNLPIFCKDLGEILIVGINNSTSQISVEALEDLKRVFSIGKPIILATHVPLNSQISNGLAEESKKIWGDRNLTWDENGTSYTANENTKEFLKMVYAEDSPVKAILAGHLHFKYTEKINKNITQYVFDATCNGKIASINIVGD